MLCRVRLGIALDGQVGRGDAFQAVQTELGFPYLFVLGDCHYYVLHPVGQAAAYWAPARTSTLTDDQEGMLAELVQYDGFEKAWMHCPGG